MDNIPKKASFAVPMMIYQTEPSFKLDMSQLGPVFDHNIESGKLLESSDDYLNIAEEGRKLRDRIQKQRISPVKTLLSQHLEQDQLSLRNIEMVNSLLLFTIKAIIYLSHKFLRLVSATLIKIPNNGFILLDVGEGTFDSMSRHFGPYDQPHGNDQTSLES